jgi:hypothetical protein
MQMRRAGGYYWLAQWLSPACRTGCTCLWDRGKFKRVMDGYCGFCILGLYFLYLTVVKGALSVFDCSVNQDGVYILDVDPSIKCNEVRHCPASYTSCKLAAIVLLWWCSFAASDFAMRMNIENILWCCRCSWAWATCGCNMGQAGGTQESLKPAAILSFVCYTVGLPLAFLTILLRHREAIRADQTLRLANDGGSEATNPNFHIRRRYQELYRWGPPPAPSSIAALALHAPL